MATAVLMPQQGQSVESCIILAWKKEIGQPVTAGDILCEVETDKAILEVPSPASGTLLATFFAEGDEVPVLVNIAAIGEPGEAVDSLQPDRPTGAAATESAPATAAPTGISASVTVTPETAQMPSPEPADGPGDIIAISPRAKNLAAQKNLALSGLQGSGPGRRIIERDIQAALANRKSLTPLAKSMVAQGGFEIPDQGSGIRGRITAKDLTPIQASPETLQPEPVSAAAGGPEGEIIPLSNIRRVIAKRMLESLQTTAQLTLHASADAGALLAYRQRLKNSPEALDLQRITINDLLLFAVSRTLPQHPDLNRRFENNTLAQFNHIHLGVAVDTPRGLMVPVIRRAEQLTLQQIAQESKRLASACLEGKISPDDLRGGTFTVTNLGSFGVERFTPILNPPEVGILGVGNINLKPVDVAGEVVFKPHLGLSLTVNHQVVDGAPAARFLQTLSQGLAELDLLLAL